MFFPGLRRGACQEDVEASGPPAAPRGAADRRGQLRGRRGAGGCRAQRSAPHSCRAPLAAPLTPRPTLSRGHGPRLGLPGLGLPGPGSPGQLQGPGSWRAAPLSCVLCLSLLQLLQSQDVKEDAVLCCSMEVSVSDLTPGVPPTPSTCGQWRITSRTHKSWARVCRRGWWGMAS